jgi:MFS family permease
LIGIPIIPTIIFSDSFVVVLLAMSVGGIGAALTSGTNTAILYDSLIALEREGDFTQIMGKMGWYGSLSMAFAGIVGGLLAQMDMAYAWWAYFAAGQLAMLVTLRLEEPPFHHQSPKNESYLQHLGKSWRMSTTGASGYYVFYAAVVWFFFSMGFWLWQPYLALSQVPLTWFGFIYALQNVIGGFSGKQAYRLEKAIGIRSALLLIPAGLALALILESRFASRLGFVFIFLQSLVSGPFHPLLENYINERIPSSKRATVLSIKNMVNSLLFMLLSPLIGYLVDLITLQTALMLMGTLLLIVACVFFLAFQARTNAIPEATG